MVGCGQGFSALSLWMFGPRIFGCGASCESKVCSILSGLHLLGVVYKSSYPSGDSQ